MSNGLEYSLKRGAVEGWVWSVDLGSVLLDENQGTAKDKHGAMEEIASIYCSFLEMALLAQAEDFGHAAVSRMLNQCHNELFLAALDFIETNEEDPEGDRFNTVVFIPENDLMCGLN